MINKKVIKFGKSLSDLDKIKDNFYHQNDKLLKKQNNIRNIYLSQPIRKKCKACKRKLKGYSFVNHEIKYIECYSCGHVNGNHQDTENFTKKIYLSKKISYSKSYFEKNFKNFIERKNKIYDPKAKFLKSMFLNHKKIKVLDIGAGSGYFTSSLIDAGFKNAKGIELSEDQVTYGKEMLKLLGKEKEKLCHQEYSEILRTISCTDYNCITLIGVLEHLFDIEGFLKEIKKNKSIKYIFLCVPLFSFSCIFENIFEKIFNRHLGGPHTHLFTESSLKKLMKRNGFKSHSEWWFGTDFADLYRAIEVSLNKNKFQPLNKKSKDLKKLINQFQLITDKKKLSSQVHMFFKR